MKEQNKQILSLLQAYRQDEVLKAFDLYKKGIDDRNTAVIQELNDSGWYPQNKKPADREFYYFDSKYWVQTDEARERDKQKLIDAMKAANSKKKKYTGQKMDLSITDMACPKCGSKMYKQSVCSKCQDGKKGFKIRLICEENPDHELLL